MVLLEAEDEIKHLRMENEVCCAENDRLHKQLHKLQNQLCVAEDRIQDLQHKLEDALQILECKHISLTFFQSFDFLFERPMLPTILTVFFV